MIHFGAVRRHISGREGAPLCGGEPASGRDVSSEDWMELRAARAAAALCPDCHDGVDPRDVQPELYGIGRMSTAHLYAVPVLAGFDAIRNLYIVNAPQIGQSVGWARGVVAVLREQAIRLVQGVTELHHVTGGCAATIYEFADGSVAYFAPEAPDFAEAGELRDDELAAALRVLTARVNRTIGGHCDVGSNGRI